MRQPKNYFLLLLVLLGINTYHLYPTPATVVSDSPPPLQIPINVSTSPQPANLNQILSTHSSFSICHKNISQITYLKNWSEERVKAIPKGLRPMPAIYLTPWYMAFILIKFQEGGSWLDTEDILDKYGSELIGRPDGQFFMPKYQMDEVLKKAQGNKFSIEQQLGIPAGAWKNKNIIRIDIRYPQDHNIRLPCGNEIGSNEEWLPGGVLPSGYNEAVVDRVPRGCYTKTLLELSK